MERKPHVSSLKRLTEDEARAMLERIRWPHGPACPRCGSQNVYRMNGKATRAGLLRCRDCPGRKMFSVTVGTIMERSHIPLRDWVYGFAAMCASKKGVSALQLKRELGIAYKTAWFMCHRIRHAMANGPLKDLLKGVVESDEVWIGGKPRKDKSKPHPAVQADEYRLLGKKHPRKRPTKKTPVQTLVERGGRKRMIAIANITAENLMAVLRKHVDPSATIMTDEGAGYQGVKNEFADHKTVNHGKDEYYRHEDEAGVNSCESAHALLKRGIIGAFHHVSREHLQRYCDEFDFRWDHRKTDDVSRTLAAIKQAEGARLMYKQPLT